MRRYGFVLRLSVLVLFVALVAAGCKLMGIADDPIKDVSGQILNLYGEPLEGVAVKIGDKVTKTLQNGVFDFGDVAIEPGAAQLVVSADGENLHSQSVTIVPNATFQLYVNDDGNLLPNPGFEIGIGDRGYPISWRGSPLWAFGNQFRYNEEDARSGKEARVTLAFLNENGGEFGGTSTATTSTTWEKLEITSPPAPANARHIRVLLFSTIGQRGSVSMFDDLYLRKVE